MLPGLHRSIQRVCRVGVPYEMTGVSFDPAQLSGEERVLFDDGELPSAWVQWWMATATQVSTMNGAAMLTMQPGLLGRHLAEPLDLERFEEHIGSNIWSMPAGVVLAWGVAESAMNRRHLLAIPCAGAVGAFVDGCCALRIEGVES